MRWTSTSADTGSESGRPDPGLRVDAVPVDRQRSTSGLLAAAAIAVAIGFALVKPWAPEANPLGPNAPADLAAAPSGSAPTPAHVGSPRPRSADATGITSASRAIRVVDWPRLAADADHLAGQPIVTDRDIGGTDGDGTCGGSARITPFDELFAIVAEPGERVAGVRLFAIDSIRRPDIPTRIWTDRAGPLDGRALDRLTVVALPRGGIAARQYALIADTTSAAGARRLTYTICVA